jgi:hypothetical protein
MRRGGSQPQRLSDLAATKVALQKRQRPALIMMLFEACNFALSIG